jgi:hypothetical protein
MEQFSMAYVTAVASGAGCIVNRIFPDIDSVDVNVRRTSLGTRYSSPSLDVQLKATHTECIVGTEVHFKLDRRTYDRLRDPSASTPSILVVLRVPRLLEEWTHHDEDRLLVRRCAYWRSLKGEPDLPSGQKSTTVVIPRSQVFDVAACDEIFVRLADGQDP